MSHSSTKRQRSNTSRESASKTAPTAAPGLRQSPAQATRGLYAPPTGYHGNGPYDTRPQAISYATYSPNPVRDGYSTATGYPSPSSLAYNNVALGYDPQQQLSFAGYQQPYAGGHHHQPPPPPPQQQQQQQYHPVSEPPSETRHYSPTPAISVLVGQPNPGPNPGPNPRQPIQQSYADVYSHPSPHSTIYTSNNSTSSFQDPVAINTQYSLSPHTTPSGDGHNLDDQYGQDSEDARGEMTDEQATEVYHDTARSMSHDMTLPSDLSKPRDKCACKKGRGKKKQPCTWCVCTKHGQKCGPQCGCGDACASPFRDLSTFFGPPDRFPKVCGPNACFANWLAHQPNIEELDTDLMVDMVLYDHPSWANIREQNLPLAKWETKWKKAREVSDGGNNTTKKAKKSNEDRQRLEFELLRGGLGNANQDDFHGFWYSFCQLRWLMADEWEHCPECRDCRLSNEWHCEKHNQCTTKQVCSGCHGEGVSIGSSANNSQNHNNNANYSAAGAPPPHQHQHQQHQQYLGNCTPPILLPLPT